MRLFPIGIGLNDQAKTSFSIRRESLIHWTYGYKVAVLILLEKEPLLREAKFNLESLERFLEKEKEYPLWFKKIRSFLQNKPIPFIENIEASVTIMRMQIRDIETDISVAQSEINRMEEEYGINSMTYEQIQSLTGEALLSKIAENAAIATWACEHQLPDDVARALFDSQSLSPVEQSRFFSLMTDKILGAERSTIAYFAQQPQVGELLVEQINGLKKGGLIR